MICLIFSLLPPICHSESREREKNVLSFAPNKHTKNSTYTFECNENTATLCECNCWHIKTMKHSVAQPCNDDAEQLEIVETTILRVFQLNLTDSIEFFFCLFSLHSFKTQRIKWIPIFFASVSASQCTVKSFILVRIALVFIVSSCIYHGHFCGMFFFWSFCFRSNGFYLINNERWFAVFQH